MKTGLLLCLGGSVFLSAILARGERREIHLRNEVIATERGQMNLTGTNVSGLFLVQFDSHPSREWRDALKAVGVDLVKYVPDDAFIARFQGVSVEKLRSLSYVRFIGPYRPEHKIHPRLAALATNVEQSVNIMLSPRATADEVAQARSFCSSVDYESRLRQGTILRAKLRPGALASVAKLDAMLWIEPAPRRRLIDEAASKIVSGDDGRVATPTVTEQKGFAGQGVTVCVTDTGLDTGDTNEIHPDVFGRVTGFKFYPPLTDGSDGYGHGTHCAGIVAGNAATGETDPNSGQWYGLGVASSAKLFIERIFDANANEVSPAPSDEQLTQDGVRAGAQIQSDSWGNDVQGEYDTDASQFDELVRDADSVTPGDQPYILEFSAGNAGPDPQTLDSPATGKNVLATGASENITGYYAELYDLYADGPDTVCDFSSRGPCEDGRIKPDVVAPGSWIASMASSAAPDEAAIAWTVIDNYYVYMGGTSMSGPHAAGAAAEFVQYYEGLHSNAVPSPALVKAALINSAVELNETNGGPGPIPNFDEGWGRVAMTNLIDTTRTVEMLDQTVLLTTGEMYQQHTFVGGATNEALKITLAYTDVAGFPGAIPALVNDLNLVVTGPDGTVYRGNQFSGENSTPNATVSDTLNNVECVTLSQPLAGDYLIEVVAEDVVEDARLDTAAIDQDFALVVSGPLLKPDQGTIVMDRPEYTAPSAIHLEVFDPGRAGSPSVNVTLKSTTEAAGETVILKAAGGNGAFTNAVATVAGTSGPSGELAIQDEDTITATYIDSGGASRTATAIALLKPPTIGGVKAVSLGVIVLTWTTSTASSSVVYYGTNSQSLNLVASNATLTLNHSIELADLKAGATYYYMVVSTDAAGNVGTNNNFGGFYDFVATRTPPVLFVDDYDYQGESTNGSTVIDASAYTNALGATGFAFTYWNASELGLPALEDLQGFRVVIWRTTDDIVNYDGTNNTLTLDQQTMIQDYLNNGGSFFMASMGILSQLGDVPFRANVLEVAGFASNPDPPEPCDCDEYVGVPGFLGVTGDPITSDMSVALNYTNYPDFDLGQGFGGVMGPDFGDTFTPSANATTIALSTATGKCCGMRFPPNGVDSPGRVVFLSFPLDAIPETGPTPDNETALLKNALRFLDPGGDGVGTVTLNQGIYTIPSQVTVEVGDSALAGTGQTLATFSSSSFTNRLAVTLTETAHAGIFRGSMTLVAGSSNAPGQLRTRPGDILSASYFDTEVGSNVAATAIVQTNPPVITSVAAVTNIGSTVVTWTTSEPADSLVEYERGPILDHSAYVAGLVTNHAVTLTSLQPDSLYYFEVTSRDQAGNSATDNNQGALFTFTTPKILQPPWFDNLESGMGNWSVVPDPTLGQPDPTLNWQLGAPATPLVTQAHSGVNAWGIPLNGTSQDAIAYSSYLYSPFIDLSGLSQATLTYWDAFDFSSGLEDGVIMISTNASEPVADLLQYVDYSGLTADSWEQETNDLTPFVGQTIQIVWYYEGVSIGSPLDGWVIDDIGVTGVTGGAGATGTVVVSKNLASADFTLIGPSGTSQAGSGLLTTISNALPGQYVAQFGDVAFYSTPPPETNTLAASNTLTFSATYTFPDVNSNGMSDLYEQYYFGSVSTSRTQLTDTDGDGMTDYQEFIAGTDPTNAASNLRFVSASAGANDVVTFQWSADPGRIYQMQSSTDLVHWTPDSDWMQAVRSPMVMSLTNDPVGSRSFRVQVRP